MIGFSTGANACSVPPPAPPPPQIAGESDTAYAKRAATFRRLQKEENEAEWAAMRIASEEKLWDKAKGVFFARLTSSREGWVRSNYGYRMKTRIVTLKPIQWLKSRGSVRRKFELAPVDFDSCKYPGNGTAYYGAKNDVFLVFVSSTKPNTRSVLSTLSLTELVSDRSRQAVAARRRN